MKNASYFFNRLAERCWELRLGIDSHGPASPHPDQGPRTANSDAVEYVPVPFRAFFHAMKNVPTEFLSGTFLDYGAGTGRALVLAARYHNFHRVLGVEISPELCRLATSNFQKVRHRKPEIVCQDAATFQPPSDTTVFFLYNPFFGETMQMVVQNIRRSLLIYPRRAAIVVCRPVHFLSATAGQNWIAEKASGKIMSSFTWRVFVTQPEPAGTQHEKLSDVPRSKLA